MRRIQDDDFFFGCRIDLNFADNHGRTGQRICRRIKQGVGCRSAADLYFWRRPGKVMATSGAAKSQLWTNASMYIAHISDVIAVRLASANSK